MAIVRTAPKAAPKASARVAPAPAPKAGPKAPPAAPKAPARASQAPKASAAPAAAPKAPMRNGAPPRAAAAPAAAPKAPAADIAALVATIEGMKGTIADLQGKLAKASNRGPKLRTPEEILSAVDVDAVLSDDDPRRDWHGVELPIRQFRRDNRGGVAAIEGAPPCRVLIAIPSDDDRDGARKRATGCLMAHYAKRANGAYEGEGEDLTIEELNELRAD